MSKLSIRSYGTRDQAQVIELWNTVFPDDPPHNAPSIVIRNKLRMQPELFYVGVLDEAVVATVLAGFDGVRGWIHHLAVHPDHRRDGHGRDMMSAAERGLAGLGCPKVNLQVRATNEVVVRFYEELGYRVEERVSMGKHLP